MISKYRIRLKIFIFKMIFSAISKFCAEHKSFFAFNMKILFYMGLWLKDNWPPLKIILYTIYEYTLHIISALYLIMTGIGTVETKDDAILFLSNLDKTLVCYIFYMKVIIFVIRRKKLEILINEIEYSGDKLTEERKQLMCHLVLFVTVVSTGTVGAFSALAQFKGEMTVEAWMPFDPMKNRMNLAMAAQILAICFMPCMYRYICIQGIICSIIMYICDQLVDVQQKLKALKYSPENQAEIKEEFDEIIKKHVRLMGYCKTMTDIFKEFFLIQNLAITIELCLNAMMVTVVGMDDKKLLASFLSFLAIALINAYIFCYLGNEVIIQSQGIASAAYETDWISWPVEMQKDLLFVIRVAQKPLQLSAGGITNMSIQTFSQALYNGYSIFAVLNDIVD